MDADQYGHLFVIRGDLTKLACNAVIVPCSRQLQVTQPWRSVVPIVHNSGSTRGWLTVDLAVPQGWGATDRVLQAPDDSLGRKVLLARTDAWRQDGGRWVADGLVQAVERAAEAVGSVEGRAVPLVGVPLAGTGAGGMQDRRGEVVQALVPALQEAPKRTGVDVALVLHDEQDHAAVQAQREPPAEGLLGEHSQDADQLGELAASGHLVLFLGAGVSLAAGLPTWKGLLRELGERGGLQDVALDGLDARDAAQLAYDVLGEDFTSFLVKRFTLDRHALAHSLLVGLDVEAAVTTNYDNGYELASAAMGDPSRPVRVLPREYAEPGLPWLLKMHGDVARPESIVLTRQQYMEYGDARAPLTGLVQALLLTRHMLFVGFSLEDDNFARLAYQVRRVLQDAGPGRRQVGTVLSLHEDPARRLLWKDDLQSVALTPPLNGTEADEDRQRLQQAAARRLEVMLDRIAWRAATTRGGSERYLLDPRYDALERPTAEEDLRKRLRELRRSAPPELRASRSWRVLTQALERLGQPSDRS